MTNASPYLHVKATSFSPDVHLTIFLIRHPEVHDDFRGICYGDSDVYLNPNWVKSIETVASWLSELREPDRVSEIWHSDLVRTREPAEFLAQHLGIPSFGDARLRERNFGSWQGNEWDKIPQEEIMLAHEMLEKPETYRPGNGETTQEVVARVRQWAQRRVDAALNKRLTIALVAHSGSITSLCGSLLGLPPSEWTPFYPKPLQCIVLSNQE